MLRSLVSSFTALLALAAAGGPVALAQTPSPASPSSGAYASLSPGNQKIARALFEAQKTRSGGTAASKPLTLDEIAARKQHGGGGWDKVVNDMKARGLVQARNLSQVVSRHQYARKGETVTASGRRFDDGSHGSRGRRQARDDGDKQGYGTQESDRGQTDASGSGRSGSAYSAVRSGGNAGNSGRGGQ